MKKRLKLGDMRNNLFVVLHHMKHQKFLLSENEILYTTRTTKKLIKAKLVCWRYFIISPKVKLFIFVLHKDYNANLFNHYSKAIF